MGTLVEYYKVKRNSEWLEWPKGVECPPMRFFEEHDSTMHPALAEWCDMEKGICVIFYEVMLEDGIEWYADTKFRSREMPDDGQANG